MSPDKTPGAEEPIMASKLDVFFARNTFEASEVVGEIPTGLDLKRAAHARWDALCEVEAEALDQYETWLMTEF